MVNRFLVPLLTVGLFLGVIGVAMATGNWIVSGREMVDVTQLSAGEEIKGWMTLQQIADGFDIAVADLYTLGGIPSDTPPATALKDLEGVVEGFDIAVLRAGVDGLLEREIPALAAATSAAAPPATAAPTASAPASTATPQPTVQARATLTDAAGATLAHAPQASGEGDGAGPTPLPAGETLAAAAIKGKHTLADIVEQAHVPLDELLATLGLPADQDPNATVRDLVDAGLVSEIDAVRDAVSSMQGE